jgi:hypothetical protein
MRYLTAYKNPETMMRWARINRSSKISFQISVLLRIEIKDEKNIIVGRGGRVKFII